MLIHPTWTRVGDFHRSGWLSNLFETERRVNKTIIDEREFERPITRARATCHPRFDAAVMLLFLEHNNLWG